MCFCSFFQIPQTEIRCARKRMCVETESCMSSWFGLPLCFWVLLPALLRVERQMCTNCLHIAQTPHMHTPLVHFISSSNKFSKSYTLLSLFGKNIFFSFFALHISNFSFLNHLAISICHSFVLFLLLLLCSISAWATKHYNVAVLKHERSLAWLLLALLNDETHDAQCHSRKKDTH